MINVYNSLIFIKCLSVPDIVSDPGEKAGNKAVIQSFYCGKRQLSEIFLPKKGKKLARNSTQYYQDEF